jgi:hypothetical protein
MMRELERGAWTNVLADASGYHFDPTHERGHTLRLNAKGVWHLLKLGGSGGRGAIGRLGRIDSQDFG